MNTLNNEYEGDIFCQRYTLGEKQQWNEGGDDVKFDKDRFIELAQEALEQVKMEEEQTSVFQELLEVFIAQTGAPKVANVIFEQFNSQDVIEKTAEDLYEQRRNSCSDLDAHILKEPTNLEEVNIQQQQQSSRSVDRMLLVSEYLWKLFRLLLLASLVCLAYHYFINY